MTQELFHTQKQFSISELSLKNSANQKDWDNVVFSDGGLLFASSKYINLLEKILSNSSTNHFGCYYDNQLIAVMPVFVTANINGIKVSNSSPYYGSHGGVYTCLSGNQRVKCVEILLEHYQLWCQVENITLSNIVEPLQNKNKNLYQTILFPWKVDERIGQIILDIPLGEEALFQSYHYKTRNMVRKAQKTGIIIEPASRESLETALDFLHQTHQENMTSISGKSKDKAFFKAILEIFDYETDWLIYEAWQNENRIASLLVFMSNGTMEYYTPVIKEIFRSFQPMSLLIHHALQDATKRGCQQFNFGGTWKTQEGVYRFKSRWGATDIPYNYYISKYVKLSTKQMDELHKYEAFSGFYLFPY
jgi:hypothetical protein